jgi:hypothetical protein
MRQSVRDVWLTFNNPLEGRVHWMYLDVKGLVSTAVGILIDASRTPLQAPTEEEREVSHRMARRFAWRREDGTLADDQEIDDEWDSVKSMMEFASHGGGTFESRTTLRLTDDEVDRIVFDKLDEMEGVLTSRPEFAGFADFPADAQLGLLSMSWGMGPMFRFPRFQAFVASGDWAGAATECRFSPEIGTIVTRNDHDQQLFRNAAAVVDNGLDPDVLVWPGTA